MTDIIELSMFDTERERFRKLVKAVNQLSERISQLEDEMIKCR